MMNGQPPDISVDDPENPFGHLLELKSPVDVGDAENPFREIVSDPPALPTQSLRAKAGIDDWTPDRIWTRTKLGLLKGVQGLKQEGGGALQSQVGTALVAGLAASGLASPMGIPSQTAEPARALVKPLTDIAKFSGRLISQEARDENQKLTDLGEDVGGGKAGAVAEALAGAAVSTVPSLVAASFSGIGGAAGAAGLQTFGQMYDEGYQKYRETLGEDEARRKALVPALIGGTITAGATRAFGGVEKFVESLAHGGLTKIGTKKLINMVLKASALEAPEEFIDQLGQGITEKFSYNPQKDWPNIFKEAMIAGLIGLGLGVGTAGGIGGIKLAAESAQTGVTAGTTALERKGRLTSLRAGQGTPERAKAIDAAYKAKQEAQGRENLVNLIMSAGQKGTDATGIRSDQGQPSETGPLPTVSEDTGRENLQFETQRPPQPVEPGKGTQPAVQEAPITPAAAVEAADAQVDTAPTEAQKEAGNFTKGHVNLHGLDITVEIPLGGQRTGTDKDGKPWSVTMPTSYGYVKRTKGADGEHADVYIGPNPAATGVLIINQRNPDTGKFDEQKAILGFNDRLTAEANYEAAFSDGKGRQRIQSSHWVTIDDYKAWLKDGDPKKPFRPAQPPPSTPTGGDVSEGQRQNERQEGPLQVTPVSGPATPADVGPAPSTTVSPAAATVDPYAHLSIGHVEPSTPAETALHRQVLSQHDNAHDALQALYDAGAYKGWNKELVGQLLRRGRINVKFGLAAQHPEITNAGGVYENGGIQLFDHSFNNNQAARVLLHEYVHAATAGDVGRGEHARTLNDLLERARAKAKREGVEFYGLINIDEFVAEAFSNPKFQEFLARTRTDTKSESLWDSFINWVAQVLGIKNKSALAEVIRITGNVIEAGPASAAAEPRFAKISTPGEYHDERVAEAMLNPTQVATIHHDAMVQNIASIGHAETAFNALPAEIKAHLPFVQSRIAAMTDAKANLGIAGTPTGSLRTFVAATPDQEASSIIMGDAWQNMHELDVQRFGLGQEISRLESELESEGRKGTSVGPLATNPTKMLVRDAILHEKNNLINQQQAINAQGGDTSAINAMIRQLDRWKSDQDIVPFRVATALAKAQPLNWTQIGVDPQSGAQVAQILQNFPGLAAGIAAINAHVSPNPKVAELEKQIGERRKALEFLDRDVFNAQFRANEKEAAEDQGVSVAVKTESAIDVTWTLSSGEKVTISLQANEPTSYENQVKLKSVLDDYRAYLDPANAANQREPVVRAYRHQIYQIENFYLNPSFNPGRDQSGKLIPTAGDLFNYFTFGGYLSTLESVPEKIGGLAAGITQNRLQNLSNAQGIVRTRFEEMVNGLNLLLDKAWKAHRDIKDGITSLQQWEQEISDPIFHYCQELGSVRLQANSKYRGRTITAQDIKAAEAQKRFVDTISRAAQAMDREQAVLEPLKIHEGGPLPYDRDPQHRGPLTMPRFQRNETLIFAQAWLTARTDNAKKGKGAIRTALMNILAGQYSEPFKLLVEGNMRGATRIPSYAAMVTSPFKRDYNAIVDMIDNGTSGAPKSLQAVIDYIFGNQTVAPEETVTKEEIADQILKEIGTSLAQVEAAKPQQTPQGVPMSTIDIRSADNFFTKPRGKQVLPPTLLTYSTTNIHSQSRIKGAVYEVLGQRWVESLEMLASELNRQRVDFESRVNELVQTGKSKFAAARQVKAESRQEQIDGQNWFHYGELSYHQKRVNRQLAYLKTFAATQRGASSMDDESVSALTQLFRKAVIAPLLQVAGVVTRNRTGGTLRMMQVDYALGHAAKLGGMSIPGAKLLTAPTERVARQLIDHLKGGILEPFLAYKFFETAKGKAIRAQLNANPKFWGTWMSWMIGKINADAERYQKMKELGVAGGPPGLDQLKAYGYLFTQGGIARDELPSVTRKILRSIESVIGIAAETGATSFPLLAPRGAFSRWADLSINAQSLYFTTQKLDFLANNALIALANRANAGVLPSEDTQLTPEEFFRNRFATKKNAEYLRLIFRRAGINIDKVMVDYYQRREQAKAQGQNPDDVDFLTDAQFNSIYLVFANELNRSSLANRPQALTATEWGRTFGALMGYGFGYNQALSTQYSKFSRAKGVAAKLNVEGIATTAAFLFFTVVLGGSIAELVRVMNRLIYGEESQIPSVAQAESPAEAAKFMVQNSGPFLPSVGGVFNYLLESVKPGSGIGGSGFSFLPQSYFNSVLNTVKAVAQTGDIVRPAVAFTRQWFPNTKALTNRLPFNDGSVEYYNTLRQLRSSTPADIEYRRSQGGESYRRSPVSDHIAGIVNGLNRPDGVDTEMVQRERQLAIDELTERGVANPEESVDRAVMAKRPTQSVYGRTLTASERERVLSRMTPEGRERLDKVESAFSAYAEQTGRGGGGRAGGSSTGTLSVGGGGRVGLSTRGRGRGGLRGLGRVRTGRRTSLRAGGIRTRSLRGRSRRGPRGRSLRQSLRV